MIKGFVVKFHKWKSGLGWVWKQLIQVVVPIAIAFGIAIGCYALYSLVMGAFPADQRGAPFTDVLLTVLAIAGIGIAAFGWGIYRILSAEIGATVHKNTEKSLWLSRVQQTVDSGYLYWHLYQMSNGKPLPVRRFYLLQAIRENKYAIEWIHNHMDESERPVERMLVSARNNWAYYIYELDLSIEKVGQADKAIALECVAYLEGRMSKFPDLADEISDTIMKVAGRFRPTTS